MDAARRAMCTNDLLNPLTTTFMQSCVMLLMSHFFHVVFKPFGQPGPIAQILAGLVLGPSLLSRIKKVRDLFDQPNINDYNLVISFIFRILFMFLIGLETDIPYMMRNFRQASIIAFGGLIACGTFGAAITLFVIRLLIINEHKFVFAHLMMIILGSSASPVVIRLVAELKFKNADVGRLAISSSLINEMSCMIWYDIVIAFTSRKMFSNGILCLVFTGIVTILNRFLAIWYNRRRQNQKYLPSTDVLTILLLIIFFSFIIEEFGYNSTISCFFVGVMFPREGKTTRTLLHKLTYSVNNFILPIYFGFNGFRFNVNYLGNFSNSVVVVLVILLSIGGKIIGTLAACYYLKIPRNEGVILAFILNLKGHVELLLTDVVPKYKPFEWWDDNFHNLVIIVVVLNTVIAGPVVSCILKSEEKYFSHRRTSLEFENPQSELRMLFCVYSSRHVSSKIGLISALSGSPGTPIMPYLMHLVELPKKRTKKNLMYHELEDGDQFSDEEDYGGNDVLEINDAVDVITADTKVYIHQKKVVSSFASMYEDVCNRAEDFRVSIIILTFHKHQRLDGQMETSKEDVRTTNRKVLRHASCSVGILVDRGQTGFQQPTSESEQNVVTLFFGGPDDREALTCSKRIASHPHINLTVIRFLLVPLGEQDYASNRSEEEFLTIPSSQVEKALDNVLLDDFCNGYVRSGQAQYKEKYVNNGLETLEVLKEIRRMYSLIIVGKGGRGFSPMTTGLSDWEECTELGNVGDLLASSEFNISASVLVIQQHRHPRNINHLMYD
ncbi:monovalent cation:proton antiporter, putative [Ricinus communis]|uniref:Monovalent cation:proton antiporter, putative n=1 Tax=Ricinus communis TaxID=3988 RepID=B9SVH4_RICCO|nr:monovalent cation:proton antiporter, putative [Ricinus communis]|eukprot:XP_002529993.1 cation/H(+) antiporter 2 [Ricinus communis]